MIPFSRSQSFAGPSSKNGPRIFEFCNRAPTAGVESPVSKENGGATCVLGSKDYGGCANRGGPISEGRQRSRFEPYGRNKGPGISSSVLRPLSGPLAIMHRPKALRHNEETIRSEQTVLTKPLRSEVITQDFLLAFPVPASSSRMAPRSVSGHASYHAAPLALPWASSKETTTRMTNLMSSEPHDSQRLRPSVLPQVPPPEVMAMVSHVVWPTLEGTTVEERKYTPTTAISPPRMALSTGAPPSCSDTVTVNINVPCSIVRPIACRSKPVAADLSSHMPSAAIGRTPKTAFSPAYSNPVAGLSSSVPLAAFSPAYSPMSVSSFSPRTSPLFDSGSSTTPMSIVHQPKAQLENASPMHNHHTTPRCVLDGVLLKASSMFTEHRGKLAVAAEDESSGKAPKSKQLNERTSPGDQQLIELASIEVKNVDLHQEVAKMRLQYAEQEAEHRQMKERLRCLEEQLCKRTLPKTDNKENVPNASAPAPPPPPPPLSSRLAPSEKQLMFEEKASRRLPLVPRFEQVKKHQMDLASMITPGKRARLRRTEISRSPGGTPIVQIHTDANLTKENTNTNPGMALSFAAALANKFRGQNVESPS